VRQFKTVISRILEAALEQILDLKRGYQAMVMGLTWLEDAAVIDTQENQTLNAGHSALRKDYWQRRKGSFKEMAACCRIMRNAPDGCNNEDQTCDT
jgi:hypothetical protein